MELECALVQSPAPLPSAVTQHIQAAACGSVRARAPVGLATPKVANRFPLEHPARPTFAGRAAHANYVDADNYSIMARELSRVKLLPLLLWHPRRLHLLCSAHELAEA